MIFIKQLFSFQGRASRKKWLVAYFLLVIIPNLCFFSTLLIGVTFLSSQKVSIFELIKLTSGGPQIYMVGLLGILGELSHLGSVYGVFVIVFAVFLLVGLYLSILTSFLGVTAKRFHDRDKSGWWALLHFVPWIGTLWIIFECGFLKGTTGPNQYGPDPLETGTQVVQPVESISPNM